MSVLVKGGKFQCQKSNQYPSSCYYPSS